MGFDEELKKIQDGYQQVTTTVQQATTAVKSLTVAFDQGITKVDGLAVALHTIFDIQGMIAAGYKTGTQAGGGTREATTQAHNEDIARRLENLEKELTGAFGKDNFAASVIENQVQALRAGVLTPNQAMEVIRGVLAPYFTGGQLFQQLADPNPEMRKLAEEMSRLLAGGTLNP